MKKMWIFLALAALTLAAVVSLGGLSFSASKQAKAASPQPRRYQAVSLNEGLLVRLDTATGEMRLFLVGRESLAERLQGMGPHRIEPDPKTATTPEEQLGGLRK